MKNIHTTDFNIEKTTIRELNQNETQGVAGGTYLPSIVTITIETVKNPPKEEDEIFDDGFG